MNSQALTMDSLPQRKISVYVLLLASVLVLFVPVFYDLFLNVWNNDTQSHGPIVLGIAIWFFYFKTKQILDKKYLFKPAPFLGWFFIFIGACIYLIGYSQSVYILSVLSLVLILCGLICIVFGLNTVFKYWFALFFFIFLMPWPASVIDAVTQPMKIAVSFASEHLLYWLDYPIARSGVILQIGQYKLLVADACAGLNSLFTLEAIGLLYINVINHQAFWRNVLLAILIVPISFTSNVLRVCTLALITYHFGDEAGQGFLHNFSGMILFMTALVLIIVMDTVIQKFAEHFKIKALLSQD
ncbi:MULTISPECIES: exosortase B [unclassified Methylophilus]|uniref:exosortase B n=1 Tax=unclassified Methylophilus TaxID=2630143 RepID=UPI0006FAC56D|nr:MULTISPECIES: exosortase B [unclassified Methylophilus]KQT37339.1 exosortase B [Methylophilus sp. Leaf416]KQT55492.1 exosortase B [Methylophilus sp. Leaf459]